MEPGKHFVIKVHRRDYGKAYEFYWYREIFLQYGTSSYHLKTFLARKKIDFIQTALQTV